MDCSCSAASKNSQTWGIWHPPQQFNGKDNCIDDIIRAEGKQVATKAKDDGNHGVPPLERLGDKDAWEN